MDDNFSFQSIPLIFQRLCSRWDLQTNRHLLILDGHRSHVTLKVLELAMDFWFRHDNPTLAHLTCTPTP
jgi:hypothetical protein